MNAWHEHVEVNKEILGGEPVFKDTRVAVETLFDYLEENSLKEFLNGHPSVSRKQADSVIEIAAEKIFADLVA